MRWNWLFVALFSFLLILTDMGQPTYASIKKTGSLPVCDDPALLKKLTKRFRVTERKYGTANLEITGIDKVAESAVRIVEPEETDRRFCVARAHLNNGDHTALYYLVLEQGGLASIGWGFDYCLSGYDAARAHGADCRSLRAPF